MGDIQEPFGNNPVPCTPDGPARAGRLEHTTHCGPFKPFCDSVFL